MVNLFSSYRNENKNPVWKKYLKKQRSQLLYSLIIKSSSEIGCIGDQTCFNVNKICKFPMLGTSFSKHRTHESRESLDEVAVGKKSKIINHKHPKNSCKNSYNLKKKPNFRYGEKRSYFFKAYIFYLQHNRQKLFRRLAHVRLALANNNSRLPASVKKKNREFGGCKSKSFI